MTATRWRTVKAGADPSGSPAGGGPGLGAFGLPARGPVADTWADRGARTLISVVLVPEVVLGTAQLFGLTDDRTSREVLERAWDAGFRRIDTAPSYGGGRSEPEVGAFLGPRRSDVFVATKVGLAPALGTRSGGRRLVSVARAVLPAPLTARLRRASQARASGLFDPAAVRSSLEESLRRLGGRVDRLLLHEVTADDMAPELLDVLRRALVDGDVGSVGVATQNEFTAAAVAAGADVVTVAQYAAGPLDEPLDLPSTVVVRVGHGLLGAGGEQVTLLGHQLRDEPELAARWLDAVAGSPFEGEGGLARVLLARRPPDATEVLVATTRPGRVADNYAAVGAGPLPPSLHALLADLVEATTTPRA